MPLFLLAAALLGGGLKFQQDKFDRCKELEFENEFCKYEKKAQKVIKKIYIPKK